MASLNAHKLLVVLLLGCWLVPATVANARQRPAAIVIDANTGATLYESDADGRRYPASLTKMMTIYLAFEHLKYGQLKMSTRIRFSNRAAGQAPSKLGLKAGETITVANAIKALITKSANDVATAVAEHIAGSENAFARQMTAKARTLGMRRTQFRNASGLPDSGQVTTARDMATLGLALQDDFPKRYKLFALRRFVYRSRRYSNHNRLLGRFKGTDGIKTGYTRASGFNITSNVRRDGKHLVGVVLGQRTGRTRDAVMRKLLITALRRASTQRTRPRRGRPLLVARPRPASRPAPARRRRHVAARPIRRGSVQRSAVNSAPTVRMAAVKGRRRVRRPSTFGQQMSQLKRAPQLVQRRTSRPTAWRQTIGHATTHQVQIGAFVSEAQARHAVTNAQARAGTILRGYQAIFVRAQSNAGPIFRARFAGFDGLRAARTCSRLKTVRVDCFVTRTN